MEINRRNNLRNTVNECREMIEKDIENQLIVYGITKKDFLSLEKLPHLSDDEKVIKSNIEKSIEKEKCAVTNQKKAVERYIRHVSFTFINRLAALRAMEVRNLIKETIIQRKEYGSMSLRERGIQENNHTLLPDEVLVESLIDAFREVSKEIKVLFDIDSEYSIIFPSSKVLRDLIQLLSENITEADWMEDDIIGWIYQYYNTEARAEFKRRRKKASADDIPIISQFYTPDWIVKALTDNTLGRYWLGMNPDSNIIDFCDYIVPKDKNEKRSPKKAREIKILDPACGSGHFLIYAFDVLYQIYLEDEPETPKEDIPNLILDNNLFGIDIDLRAVQLAALSLYLKAKTFNPNITIKKMNLVCADSHITPGEKRTKFLERFNHIPPLQDIFRKTFEELNNTNEIGSLLKVREPFEDLFGQLGNSQTYIKEGSGQSILSNKGTSVPQTRFKSEGKELILTRILTINEMIQELKNFELESVENKDIGSLLFATETEKSVGLLSILTEKYDIVLMNPPHGRIISDIKDYAKKYYKKSHQDYYSAFVQQGIDLCKKEGLIGVLTGRSILITKSFIKLREEVFTEEALPISIFDLGFKTLEEAHARFAALVLDLKDAQEKSSKHEIEFFDLSTFEWDGKRIAFEESLNKFPSFEHVYVVPQKDFSEIPLNSYAYWAPKVLRQIYSKFQPLDRDVCKIPKAKKIADVKQGLATADKPRFNRFHWEIPSNQIASNRDQTFCKKKWVPFADEFYLFYFYQDVPEVVNWGNNGYEVRNFYGANGKLRSRPQNISFFFKSGLLWSANLQRTQLPRLWEMQRIPFRIFPEGCIFGIGAQAVILDSDNCWTILGYMTSRLIFAVSRMINSENKQGTATTAFLPVCIPFKEPNNISSYAKEAHDILREQSIGNETSTIFIKPWMIQILNGFNLKEKPTTGHPLSDQFEWFDYKSLEKIRSVVGFPGISLKELAKLCIKREEIVDNRVEELQNSIDEEVYDLYEISREDRVLIEKEMELRKLEVAPEGEKEELTKEEQERILNEKIKDHVIRLISYYSKLSIEEDEDGIVPLGQLHEGVKTKLSSDFGEERLEELEDELYEILGKPLNNWLSEDYFNYHLNLYRKRPIFWQITSYQLGEGRTKVPGAFSCFVNYHKINRDMVPKIIAHYLNDEIKISTINKQRVLKDLESARIEGNSSKIRKREKEYDIFERNVNELERFKNKLNEVNNPREDKKKLPNNPKWVDEKIKEIRDEGWSPVLDYGVRVNIEPLKEAKILPKSANGVK